MSNSEPNSYHSGYVALVGRPNAGKSTLLNRLVGQKIAAVSNKPQTTRFKIQGVITKPAGQIVLVDTPGVHQPGYELNRRMMATVQDALLGVDLVCLLRDASVSTGQGDRFVLDLIKRSEKPALLLLNKIDKLEDKAALLPLIDWYSQQYNWREVVPISALKDEMTDVLLDGCLRHLPAGDPIFSEDELTDQSLRVLVAEIVREKLLQRMGDEIPYVTAVLTELFEEVREDTDGQKRAEINSGFVIAARRNYVGRIRCSPRIDARSTTDTDLVRSRPETGEAVVALRVA